MTHLLLLWCWIGVSPPAYVMREYICTQKKAFRVLDAGEAPENDGCAAALRRWIDRKEAAAAGDGEYLRIVCEVPI